MGPSRSSYLVGAEKKRSKAFFSVTMEKTIETLVSGALLPKNWTRGKDMDSDCPVGREDKGKESWRRLGQRGKKEVCAIFRFRKNCCSHLLIEC